MLGAVGGAINGAVFIGAVASILRAARDQKIQSAFIIARDAPGERFFLRDAGIFQRPALAAGGGFVDAAAETSDVERARIDGACWIEKDEGRGGLVHAVVRFRPGFSAVVADADAAAIFSDARAAPHFWTRQIVRPTIHAPGAAFDGGIEDDPVSGVAPVPRYAVGGLNPRFAAIFAAKEADIGRGDELAVFVEGIEVVAVGSGHVEAGGGPSAVVGFLGIDSVPCRAAVGGFHCAAEVGGIDEICVLIGDGESQRIFGPVGAKFWSDPRIMNVCAGLAAGVDVFFPDEFPRAAGVGGFGDAHVLEGTVFEIAIGDVGDFGMQEACGDCALLYVALPELHFAPVCAEVVGDGCGSLVRDRVENGIAFRSEADGNVGDFLAGWNWDICRAG